MRIFIVFASAGAILMAAGVARADGITAFHTPSKNIYCQAIKDAKGGFIDCEILSVTSSAPLAPRPADCDLEWGNRFQLGEAGAGYLACTGDTLRDDKGLNLAYGKSFQVGGITCGSSQQGLQCRNGAGHGFFLSRGRQRLF
jgi:hypothetical protein